jgi:exosortase
MTTAPPSDATTPVYSASPPAPRRRWNSHLLAAFLLMAVAIAATWPVWVRIFTYAARNEEQSHSFLAIPVAAWLVWVRRHRLKALAPEGSAVGLGVIAAGWAMAAFGFATSIDLALDLGCLIIVLGAAYAALGTRVLLRLLPAIGALILVLPVPGRVRRMVAAPLQEWSAQISHFGLELFGVPALRSGSILTINGVDVAIAEACNGMRMVSALAVVTYAFVFTQPFRPAVRLMLLLVSPVIALTVNVVRLVPTTLFYGYSSAESAELFHDWSGWGVLFLALFVLLGLISLLRWLEFPIDQAKAPPPPPSALPTRSPSGSRRWLAPLLAAVLLGAILALGGFQAKRTPGMLAYHASIREAVDAIPYRIGAAVGTDQQVSPGVLRLLKPNAFLQRSYRNPATGHGFGLVVIHCSDARDLVDHYPPVCYPSAGWTACGMNARQYQIESLTVPARIYDFTRSSPQGAINTRVVSFFVVPTHSSGVVDTMEAVAAASRSTRGTALGAAHIMVSFGSGASDNLIEDTIRSVLEQLEPTIRTTAGGPSSE